MTILLLALLCWTTILVLTVGLCVAARDGDAQQSRTSPSQWHEAHEPATSTSSADLVLAEHEAPSVAATRARAA